MLKKLFTSEKENDSNKKKKSVSERIQDAVDDGNIEEIGRIQEEVLGEKILKKNKNCNTLNGLTIFILIQIFDNLKKNHISKFDKKKLEPIMGCPKLGKRDNWGLSLIG